ncbi:MAG: adenine deaminase [Bacteriovoracia bacterium]
MSAKQSSSHFRKKLRRRLEAAQGRVPCDLLIRDVQYLDVFSARFRRGDIAVKDGVIVGLEPGLKAKRTIEGRGKWVVPGFIDAHVHLESSLMLPPYFEAAVLPKGTTTAICDPHELANVVGPKGIQYFLDSADRLTMDLWVMMSSCVPATHLETNGGGAIEATALTKLGRHPRALGLAEMMNIPGVLAADPKILAKLVGFSGRPIDGHSPLLRGQALSAYAASGITSCHESSELEEAREKLTKGISVWIREGSVAKDLEALLPVLDLGSSSSVGFCTDDRNPLDIAEEGHVDHLVRKAMRLGVAPEVTYRSASWTVARHYGLDRVAPNRERIGAIAPGYGADFILLSDLKSCAVAEAFKSGRLASEIPRAQAVKADLRNTLRARTPHARDLEGPAGQVHVMEVLAGKIITERSVDAHDASGVARISVLERYGHGRRPANAYVRGFGGSLRGAIASSVGHDSHNLIVVGDKLESMRTALAALIESGGGFCVARDQEVLSRLPLPFGGLMSERTPAELKHSLVDLKAASRAIGCELVEPFLQLAFLSLPVIPSLKLTDRGLVDVDQFKLISVRA